MVAIQMHHDGGDNLRVFIADHLRHRGGIHPLQAFDARALVALQDAVDQVRGLVVAQRLPQHGTDVLIGIDKVDAAFRLTMEFAQYRLHLLAASLAHAGHRHAQLLHILGTEILEHFGGFLVPQCQHQDSRLSQAVVIAHSLTIHSLAISAVILGFNLANSRTWASISA